MHKAFEAGLKEAAGNYDPEVMENVIALFAAKNLSEAEQFGQHRAQKPIPAGQMPAEIGFSLFMLLITALPAGSAPALHR